MRQTAKYSKTLLAKLFLTALSTIALTACGGGSDDNPSTVIPTNPVNFTFTATGVTSSVSIMLNGEELTLLSSNGDFDSEISLAADTDYDLSYESSNDQLCNIDTPTGIINSDSFSVNIHCLNWVDPVNAADNISPNSEDATKPQVAIGNNGDIIVAWMQSNGSDLQIFKSEFRNGAWIHPSSIIDSISPSGEDAMDPQVSINSTGETIVTWVQFDGFSNQIFISEYRNNSWLHPVDLTDSISVNGQYSYQPDAAIGDNGEAVVAWSQSDGSRDQIFISEYRSGSWVYPADLTDNISPNGNDTNEPYVVINATGETVIAWRQFNNGIEQVYMSEYRSSTWTHPTNISDFISPATTSAFSHQLDINDNGETLIVWRQSDGNDDQVFMSEYRNNSWAHPSSLTDNISPDGQDIFDPRVSVGNNGNAAIAWRQLATTHYQIFMSSHKDGTWTHPTDLDDFRSLAGQNAASPDVSINSKGDVVLTWQQLVGIRQQVFKSEYRNNKWISPVDTQDNISLDSQDALRPKVASNDNGEAIIIWEQVSGGNFQVFKSEHQ